MSTRGTELQQATQSKDPGPRLGKVVGGQLVHNRHRQTIPFILHHGGQVGEAVQDGLGQGLVGQLTEQGVAAAGSVVDGPLLEGSGALLAVLDELLDGVVDGQVVGENLGRVSRSQSCWLLFH